MGPFPPHQSSKVSNHPLGNFTGVTSSSLKTLKSSTGFKRGIKRQSISGDNSCLSTETGSDISWSEIWNNHLRSIESSVLTCKNGMD